MPEINPMVVDLSHHNTVTSFENAYKFGIRGIIHKATEGSSYVDATYKARRIKAIEANMLWGAYHFFRPGNVDVQVKHFLKHAQPEAMTLLALDHEDARCSVAEVEEFLRQLEAETGQVPVLYSGHLIKEQLGRQVHPYLKTCRLWMAQYGNKPVVQDTWDTYWLWQYTGDGVGPKPDSVPGLGNNIDVNSFQGTLSELARSWAQRRDGMSGETPAPRPVTKADITKWGQATLNLLGCNPRLIVDGSHGSQTMAAVKAFQESRGLEVTGLFKYETLDALHHEVSQWMETVKV